MSTLLEAIATENASHLGRLTRAYEAESESIRTTASPNSRALKVADAARLMCRSTVNELDSWVSGVEQALRKGMNKDDFRALVMRGFEFLDACKLVVGTVAQDFEKTASATSLAEVSEARNMISQASNSLAGLESKLLAWRKIADRQPPEIDPALIELGAQQVRERVTEVLYAEEAPAETDE